MAIFSDLPNELILGILGHVLEPDDVMSFALVSKRICGLSSATIKDHASLNQRYSVIKFSRYGKSSYEPADLLKRMILDPRIAFHVNSLQILSRKARWRPRLPLQACSKDDMALFEDAIRATPLIAASEIKYWSAGVEKGDMDPLIALTLMRLTKLKALALWDLDQNDDLFLLRTFRRMLQSPAPAIRTQQSVTGTNNKDAEYLTCARPSVFATIDKMWVGRSDETFDIALKLLHCTKDLKSFDFHLPSGSDFGVHQVCARLSECARDSLRRLGFHAGPDGIGNVTRFPRLTEVSVNVKTLLGNWNDTLSRLADVLPASIQGVWINCATQIFPAHILTRLILDMVKSKVEHQTSLRNLTFYFQLLSNETARRNRDLITELQGMALDHGVRLSVHGGVRPLVQWCFRH